MGCDGVLVGGGTPGGPEAGQTDTMLATDGGLAGDSWPTDPSGPTPDQSASGNQPDPCAGIQCTSPPAAACLDSSTLRTYAVVGICSAGTCSYPGTDKPCTHGCSSGACNPAPTASCTDGKKNQTESDVDCGGVCNKCADGKICSGAADCTSGYCSGTCQTNPYTPDGCLRWSGGITLQAATNANTCVEVQAGIFITTDPVVVPGGHTIRGKGKAISTVTVPEQTWTITPFEAVIGTFYQNVVVKDLTIDGKGVATYAVGATGMTISSCVLKNTRCSGVGVAGPGMVVRDSEIVHAAHHTIIAGRGDINCATLPPGVELGGAIYAEGKADSWAPLIENNVIHDIRGPALDVNGAWGGTFRNNKVYDIIGWASIGLYGASYWTISGNDINHAWQAWTNTAHPYCEGGPGGKHSAAIWLCQDQGAANGLTTNYNKILNNVARSYYGILSIGADELTQYQTPRLNTFSGNNVFGSQVGCADDFKPGQWFSDDSVWSANNCQGSSNTAPVYF